VVVTAGDIIIAKDRDDEGILIVNGNIMVNDKEQSLQAWLKEIYGWSSAQTYVFAILKDSGKSLIQIREEYMEQQAMESTNELLM
jgi:hypothetical protein